MGDKYYTPTIDEFHVGFEYETPTKDNVLYPVDSNIWEKKTVSTKSCMERLKYDIMYGARVKYLDREDIESLGFEYIKETGINEKLDFFKRKQFKSKNYKLQWFKNGSVMISSNNNDLEDELKGHPDRLRFEGIIKNKSELNKVLKMIGYGEKQIR